MGMRNAEYQTCSALNASLHSLTTKQKTELLELPFVCDEETEQNSARDSLLRLMQRDAES
jgi:hypothetical protein